MATKPYEIALSWAHEDNLDFGERGSRLTRESVWCTGTCYGEPAKAKPAESRRNSSTRAFKSHF